MFWRSVILFHLGSAFIITFMMLVVIYTTEKIELRTEVEHLKKKCTEQEKNVTELDKVMKKAPTYGSI
jgi:cell division protein FtsL